MRIIITIITIMLLLTACSFGDNLSNMRENRMLSKMKAEDENQFHLYSFWTEGTETEFDTFDYSRVDTNVFRLLSFHQKENAKEYIESLEIREFPTFIVLDNKGIVLRTTSVNEINDFLTDYQ
ncbi:MAG: hypothetical protein ACK4M9_03820 [Anaerobacillus sp.]|uniref:hypothetical protein n=1 Tax=Anaerobacillus sp. TaxID=1872506 RepID=UPI00391A5D44